jgi:threonine aldolase
MNLPVEPSVEAPLRGDVDLRSDTVTLPSERMFDAARAADLGDDVYREDPTVARLEAYAAELLGLGAGLFLPSGTMANLCALLTHSQRGQRVVCGRESHVYRYEAGGASALGGLVYQPLPNAPDGGLDEGELGEALAPSRDEHLAPAGVLTLENTQNRMGGLVLDPSRVTRMVDVARAHRIPVHIDGARLFNAAAALGCAPSALVAGADSVQLCLSKGLGAPLGSLLVGTATFIEQARRVRKMLGGGMRQAGVAAAMGLVALRENRARLEDDHARASRLAALLSASAGDHVAVRPVASNMVFLEPRMCSPEALVARSAARGVRIGAMGSAVRAVTHLGVDDAAIERAAHAIAAAAVD